MTQEGRAISFSFIHGIRAIWSASGWSGAGSMTLCRFRGRRTANKLVRGDLVLDGKVADPAQITCPVLVLAHTGDVLAPPESAEALLEVVSSADRDALTVSGGTLGHVDIVVGPEGPAIMWPKLAAWLDARSGAGP